jgi:hypothetical protein
MKKHSLLCSVALSCLLLSASCSRTITCNDGAIRIMPVGFAKADFDSATVVKYKPGGTFDSVIDVTTMVRYSYEYKDTGEMTAFVVSLPDSTHPYFLVPKYDYKIMLPAIGKTYAITNIKQTGQTHMSYSTGLIGNTKMVTCTNSIVSVSLDGNTVVADKSNTYISVYLTK